MAGSTTVSAKSQVSSRERVCLLSKPRRSLWAIKFSLRSLLQDPPQAPSRRTRRASADPGLYKEVFVGCCQKVQEA
eukprot:CAMPEP_0204235912 /NCGR_PEP_ID=MMETSP0361-20130328/92050_1 /ASSEMBLY_ACC=CAM_ASM_000343 /TAXON_ID=268821 /ORGANISM="Scrippsiella Hangoei, Strain SHTV-5" /LENGTH=75 /DNA_ID=CAMNT_0051207577 /DNA_START=38 /DNA_END=261 /DNA_ORIENTATION=+